MIEGKEGRKWKEDRKGKEKEKREGGREKKKGKGNEGRKREIARKRKGQFTPESYRNAVCIPMCSPVVRFCSLVIWMCCQLHRNAQKSTFEKHAEPNRMALWWCPQTHSVCNAITKCIGTCCRLQRHCVLKALWETLTEHGFPTLRFGVNRPLKEL